MRTKIFIFICGISLVLLFGVAFCRSGYINLLNLVGFPLSSLVGFLLYGFLTVICLYKFRVKLPPKYILLAIWMGVGLLETIYRCYSFKSSIISIPIYTDKKTTTAGWGFYVAIYIGRYLEVG